MNVATLIQAFQTIGIQNYIGVPDSTLKPLCDYLNLHEDAYHHTVTVNEGAAVALGAGRYIGNDELSCVYMQNSGMGNALNPIVSLIHEQVYDIPMLFVIGYRGEPGIKDEPQHIYQGKITLPLLEVLGIEYALLDQTSTAQDLDEMLVTAKAKLQANKQFAIVMKKNALSQEESYVYDNGYSLKREDVIHEILSGIEKNDLLITTTGKISREAYEQSDLLYGNHNQLFLTVGSMGHASMIALGVAQSNPNRRVICIDGDGAALMHMGSMNYIANRPCENFVHIVLNNAAHESVGGMPTDCRKSNFAQAAEVFGYCHTHRVFTMEQLHEALRLIAKETGPILLEVPVALGSRADLGRPKENAKTNKEAFMNYRKGCDVK